MMKTLLFDMDGVIADTDRTRFDLLQVLVKRRGLELADGDYKKSVGRRTEVFLKDVFGGVLNDDEVKAIYDERKEEYRRNPGAYVIAQPHATECCRGLFDAGLQLIIASASEESDIRMVLDELQIAECFSGVVGADSVTHPKPHPETYLRCLEKFSLTKEECIAVEDSPTGIRSANAAGVFCIAVTSTHVAEELRDADVIIAPLEELTPEFVGSLAIG